jgi:hypothetical protein
VTALVVVTPQVNSSPALTVLKWAHPRGLIGTERSVVVPSPT